MFLFSYVFFLFLIADALSQNEDSVSDSSGMVMARWSQAAYKWIMDLNCLERSYFTEETCTLVKRLEKINFRVYGTEPIPGQKFGVVFPEAEPKHKTFHDGVLVMDPFPLASFGHPIAVFHVNENLNNSKCDSLKGSFIENNSCIEPISRSYFNTHMHSFRPKMRSANCPNCGEVMFLPLVYAQTDQPTQANDRLKCFSNLAGFDHACPRLRSRLETNHSPCDPILTNRNCGFFETRLGSRCSPIQTCDHAVLISGGWNRQLSDMSTFNNVRNIRWLLTLHGYLDDNIITFYANGPEEPQDPDDAVSSYRSASLKRSIRSHIRTVCDSDQCADTLFIYLNSPTRPDGASLLWDTFDNGVYQDAEIYSARELMRDIAYCKANRVVIMADQNYGASLVAAADARFSSLENVVIFTANEYFNWNTTKDRITRLLIKAQYNDVCLQDFKDTLYQTIKSPMFLGANPYLLNSTLVGAPCKNKTTSLNDPETFKYRGCTLLR